MSHFVLHTRCSPCLARRTVYCASRCNQCCSTHSRTSYSCCRSGGPLPVAAVNALLHDVHACANSDQLPSRSGSSVGFGTISTCTRILVTLNTCCLSCGVLCVLCVCSHALCWVLPLTGRCPSPASFPRQVPHCPLPRSLRLPHNVTCRPGCAVTNNRRRGLPALADALAKPWDGTPRVQQAWPRVQQAHVSTTHVVTNPAADRVSLRKFPADWFGPKGLGI